MNAAYWSYGDSKRTSDPFNYPKSEQAGSSNFCRDFEPALPHHSEQLERQVLFLLLLVKSTISYWPVSDLIFVQDGGNSQETYKNREQTHCHPPPR